MLLRPLTKQLFFPGRGSWEGESLRRGIAVPGV